MRPSRTEVGGWLGYAAAVLLGLPSLAYAYGRDQALFDYVGSGWLLGQLPYVDAFDNKPPGIFLLHAALAYGFGAGHPFAIRLAEIAAVLVIGALLGRILHASGERAPGLGGVCAFLTSAFYFSCFDYWDTAQVELWEAGFLVAALWAALGDRRPLERAALSGVFLGFAVLFKLPAVVPGLVIALVAVRAPGHSPSTGWTSSAGRLAVCAACAVLAAGAGLVPFARAGALGTVHDVLIGFNAHYATSKVQHVMGPAAFWLSHAYAAGALLAGLCAMHVVVALANGRRDVARTGLSFVGLLLSAIASVALQRKFYPYHWGVTVPFFGLAAGWAVSRTARMLDTPPLALTALWAAAMLVAAPRWPSNQAMDYPRFARALVDDVAGRDALARHRPFIGMARYDHDAMAELGQVVRARAASDDALCVAGFEPVPYVVSGLRCPSRFFADHPLTDPALAFRRAQWSTEHAAALTAHPPEWIIVELGRRRLFGLDLRDYDRVVRQGAHVLLRRSEWRHRSDAGSHRAAREAEPRASRTASFDSHATENK